MSKCNATTGKLIQNSGMTPEEKFSELLKEDKESREVIRNQHKINLLIDAGAGSGKTSEMANRICTLVSSDEVPKSGSKGCAKTDCNEDCTSNSECNPYRQIGEIVAITFTRKAANELRDRIRGVLRKHADTEKCEVKKKRFQTAYNHIHECFIGTIHSFCKKILSERPIEAKITPGFGLIEDAQDNILLKQAWEDFIIQAKTNNKSKEILLNMEIFDINESVARGLIKILCEQPDIVMYRDMTGAPPTAADIITKAKAALTEIEKLVYGKAEDGKYFYDKIPDRIRVDPSEGDDLQQNIIKYRKMRNIERFKDLNDLSDRHLISLVEIFWSDSSVGTSRKGSGSDEYCDNYTATKAETDKMNADFLELRERIAQDNNYKKSKNPLEDNARKNVIKILNDVKAKIDEYEEILNTDGVDEAKIDRIRKSAKDFQDKWNAATDRNIEDTDDAELRDLLRIYSTKKSVEVKRTFGLCDNYDVPAEETDEMKAAFKDCWDNHFKELVKDISDYVIYSLIHPIAEETKKLYEDRKRNDEVLTRQDLMIKTAELLRDYPDVRTYFQGKYKTLLVDEFQDTDPIQTEIVMYLTGEDVKEKEWSGIIPREGSLFVVGDPKQSIYKFRRADIRLYNKFKKLNDNPPDGREVRYLRRNFRSKNELIKWYNENFEKLLPGGDNQAEFESMISQGDLSESLPNSLKGVDYYFNDEEKSADIVIEEPKLIAKIIKSMVDEEKKITVWETDESGKELEDSNGDRIPKERPIEYKDIMVLVLKKKQLETVANAVGERGIPVKITGADITNRTSEFAAFADLVRLIAAPKETAYLYSVMRSDFFRFTDQEIFRFIEIAGALKLYYKQDKFDELRDEYSNDHSLINNVEKCLERINRYAEYFKKFNPAVAAELIIEDLDIMQIHLETKAKLSGLSSFVSLVEKIRMSNIADIWGLKHFVDELAVIIDSGIEEDVAVEGHDFNAVRFMNLHKSKGLEAPVVILAVPTPRKSPTPTFHIEYHDEQTGSEENHTKSGYMRYKKNPDSNYSKSYVPREWTDDIKNKATTSDREEFMRLLYVAATRAMNYLIICDSYVHGGSWTSELLKLLPGKEGERKWRENNNILVEWGLKDNAEMEDKPKSENQAETFRDPDDLEKNDYKLKKREQAFDENSPSYETRNPSEEAKKAEKEDIRSDSTKHNKDSAMSEGAARIKKSTEKNDYTMSVALRGDKISMRKDSVEIGNIVHKILETAIMNEPALKATIPSILSENKDKPHITEEFLNEVVERFKEKKSLLERLAKAGDNVHCEVPFTYKETKTAENTGEQIDTYINGIIDLVFKENGKWVILDFKTYENKQPWDYYYNQLELYKKVWEKMTGEDVGSIEIFLIQKILKPVNKE